MVAASAAFALGSALLLSGCVAEPAPAPVTIIATVDGHGDADAHA